MRMDAVSLGHAAAMLAYAKIDFKTEKTISTIVSIFENVICYSNIGINLFERNRYLSALTHPLGTAVLVGLPVCHALSDKILEKNHAVTKMIKNLNDIVFKFAMAINSVAIVVFLSFNPILATAAAVGFAVAHGIAWDTQT